LSRQVWHERAGRACAARFFIRQKLMSLKKPCAYCGELSDKRGREHLFPSNLYPSSKAKSKVQRLIIPACTKCNNSWSDDEVHFRNMLVIAGDPPTPVKKELWNTDINHSFSKFDGFRRRSDLLKFIMNVKIDGQERQKIYPGNDPRVIRIIQKIVKGLCYYHLKISPLPDEKIWADILKYPIQENFLEEMIYCERDPEIVEYRYQVLGDDEIQSVWLLRFFQTTTFIAIVDK
jgi:hypothetical protein